MPTEHRVTEQNSLYKKWKTKENSFVLKSKTNSLTLNFIEIPKTTKENVWKILSWFKFR